MSWWTDLRDGVEAGLSVVGNLFVPGSSLITSQVVSKGAQEVLKEPIIQAAQIATSVAGAVSPPPVSGEIWSEVSGAANKAATAVKAAAGSAPAQAQPATTVMVLPPTMVGSNAPTLTTPAFSYNPATGATGVNMETPQGTPNPGATPQAVNIVPPATNQPSGLLIFGALALLYLVKSK